MPRSSRLIFFSLYIYPGLIGLISICIAELLGAKGLGDSWWPWIGIVFCYWWSRTAPYSIHGAIVAGVCAYVGNASVINIVAASVLALVATLLMDRIIFDLIDSSTQKEIESIDEELAKPHVSPALLEKLKQQEEERKRIESQPLQNGDMKPTAVTNSQDEIVTSNVDISEEESEQNTKEKSHRFAPIIILLLAVVAVGSAVTSYQKIPSKIEEPKVAVISPQEDETQKKLNLNKHNCLNNDANACYLLADYYYNESHREEAIEYAEKGCKLNHGESCTLYAVLQATTAKYTPQVVRVLFEKGCSLKDGIGCALVGDWYREGHGGKVSYSQSAKFYRKGCDLDHGPSCFRLGEQYFEGKGVKRNRKRAIALFKKACDEYDENGCRMFEKLSPAKKK